MLFSLNWISEFVNLEGINRKELIGRFTLSTAEVEEIYELGNDIQNVVVGEIVEVMEHPTSEKLHLLQINLGNEVVPCVCGAPNVTVGEYVAFAKTGGMVGGKEICRTTIAGYESYGMCCSEQELGISEDHSGLLILDHSHPLGTDLKSFLPLEDTIFEVDNKSLTNRPDLWGHYGIAREISVLTKRELKPMTTLDLTQYRKLPTIPVEIEATSQVYRYSCIGIQNITKHESPLWMKLRLTYCGMRPIHLLADLTNYLMLELGQPMHAFDRSLLFSTKGSHKTADDTIVVKTFQEPQSFTTLDGVTRSIDTNTLMICSSNGPAAIAGIMGGEISKIQECTSEILLESANFDAVSVRTASVRLGLRTDASAHYEKSLDPEMTLDAIARFLKLLLEIVPTARVCTAPSDYVIQQYPTISFDFDTAYVNQYTGIGISTDFIEETLTLLGFKVTRTNDCFHVIVPSYRATKDVTMKVDIIEEIARIYGYDNFEIHSTKTLLKPIKQLPSHVEEYEIKLLLAEKYRMNELHTYLWYDQRKNKELALTTSPNVRIINSVTGDNATLQSSVIPNLINAVSRNITNFPEQRLFTISRVVEGLDDANLCKERKKLGLILVSKSKNEKTLYFELKATIENLIYELKNLLPCFLPYNQLPMDENYIHPINSAKIQLGTNDLGYFSCLHPQILANIDRKACLVFAELDLDLLHAIPKQDLIYTEPTRYPEITMDLSLLLPVSMQYQQLQEIIDANSLDDLNRYELIDQYEDKDALGSMKSLTLRFIFSSMERTLESTVIQENMNVLVNHLAEHHVTLRG